MFTGIIESVAKISQISKNKGNLDIRFKSSLTNEFKIDQSISHNGICMTVVEINNDEYSVTAINETIQKSAIGKWKIGDLINIERAMKIGDRLDGHMVQATSTRLLFVQAFQRKMEVGFLNLNIQMKII